jgi:hypothetical protein
VDSRPVKPGLDGKRAEISPKQTKPYSPNRLSAQSRDLKRFGRFVIKIAKMPRLAIVLIDLGRFITENNWL